MPQRPFLRNSSSDMGCHAAFERYINAPLPPFTRSVWYVVSQRDRISGPMPTEIARVPEQLPLVRGRKPAGLC